MSAVLYAWARDWGITPVAVTDLMRRLTSTDDLGHAVVPDPRVKTERGVQALARAQAADVGNRLWRNNVGALIDERGIPVRYGLANDSKQMNAVLKSGDLIGIYRVTITPDMVGSVIGQFDSAECKEPGWRYNENDPHQKAQMAWAQHVLGLGGRARFITAGY